jgi:glutathione S-transferase
MSTVLVIGNKNYSSWSLRPWLFMKVHGIPFEERRIPLYRDESRGQLLEVSGSGRVPVLIRDGITVWDSLAILETLAELEPRLGGWPSAPAERAWARAISAEMHSGFGALRSTLPMNCRRTIATPTLSDDAQQDVHRVREIWRVCRKAHPGIGPFLFGNFTIADAMYAPVVCRFETYGVRTGPLEREYMDAILGLPAMRAWYDDARRETEVLPQFEV